MAYIGNTPALQYITFAKQTFTADSSTVAFTLDNSVANENELEVFVNNVRQEPGSGKAYTASGTTLTMSEAPTTGDDFYCIYQGKATQTVTPGASTVTNAMLAGSITNAKLANSSITLNSSAVSLGGSHSIDVTPAFSVRRNGDQTIADGGWTKIQFNHKIYDSGDFDSATNYRFTVPSGQAGKYMFFVNAYVQYGGSGSTLRTAIYKNGSVEHLSIFPDGVGIAHNSITSAIMDLSATDYIEFYAWQNRGQNDNLQAPHTVAYGFKLIGV
jgi:hypothetical protein